MSINKQTNRKSIIFQIVCGPGEKNPIQFQSKILNITPTHSSYEMNMVQCRYHDVK